MPRHLPEIPHIARKINEARETVAIADEARRSALIDARHKVRSYIAEPQTCARPGTKPLTTQEKHANRILDDILISLTRMIGDDDDPEF